MEHNMSNEHEYDEVDIVKKLRSLLEGRLSAEINDSEFFIDLADIYGISKFYICQINDILEERECSNDDITTTLDKINFELFDHLPYHLKSLRTLLSKTIEELESKGD